MSDPVIPAPALRAAPGAVPARRRGRHLPAVCAAALVVGVAGVAPAAADAQDSRSSRAAGTTFVGCGPTRSQDLINAVTAANVNPSGGSIVLASRCTYTFAGPGFAGNALPVINKPITINGRSATLTQTDALRFFEVSSTGKLFLNTLDLKRGKPSGDGGAILVDSGGAQLYLKCVNATDNIATGIGGALSVQSGSTATVTSSTLSKNTAGVLGGAIDNHGALTLTASRLSHNHADLAGGGLDQDEGSSRITTTTIDHNSTKFGGGIDHDGGPMTIDSSVITDNSATAAATDPPDPGGGGIWNFAVPLTIKATTIARNRTTEAVGNGAGILNRGGNVTVETSSVSSNTAKGTAGGIYNLAGGTIALKASRITGNSAGTKPGGVFNDVGSNVSNSFSVISLNHPTNCDGSPAPVPGCFG
ncbi:hypothetical protein ACFV3E_00315 [Streptomyces sp. NPDC059718]